MQQLSALDNLMLEGERPNLPMHMSALMIYDTGGKRGTRRMREILEERTEQVMLAHFPILRSKAEHLPMHMDRAYWVEDKNFSASNHQSHAALGQGENWEALYNMFAEFHALPLDPTRPLWQVHFVEGLNKLDGVPRGATALFLKIHHSVLDGKGAQRLMSSLHNLSPEEGSRLLVDGMDDEEQIQADFSEPSALQKYGRAWWHSIERPVELTGTLLKLLPGLWQSGKEENGKNAGSEAPPTPHARFNSKVDADRVVGHLRMEIGALRKLEKKHHCTINDIALCVIAGALRGYLQELDDLPGDSLHSLMPVSTRRRDEAGSMGNHVSVAKVALHTGTDDATERLKAIHAETTRGKRESRGGSPNPLLNLVDEIHPAVLLWLGEWLLESGRLETLPQLVNTVVTNVPGNARELYVGDARLIDYLGFGPLAPNVGLFHTVSSTEDHVNISFLSTRELLGDGRDYTRWLEQSWQEL